MAFLLLLILSLFQSCFGEGIIKGVNYKKGERERLRNLNSQGKSSTSEGYSYQGWGAPTSSPSPASSGSPVSWGGKARSVAGTHSPAPASAASTGDDTSSQANFQFYGGPVVPGIQVVMVFWNYYAAQWSTGVTTDITANGGKNFPALYTNLVNGSLLQLLQSTYSTVGLNGTDGQPGENQTIAQGRYVGAYGLSPSNPYSSYIDDTTIQSELIRAVSSGALPSVQPDSTGFYNMAYFIHFPLRVGVSMEGTGSCSDFCGYHGSAQNGNQMLYYAVLPDITGCLDGCGASGAIDNFDSLSSVASHEFSEIITDPDVAIPTGISRPLAWYDLNTGEIADTCLAIGAPYQGSNGVTFLVQEVYSRVTRTCVGPPPNIATPAPSPTPAPTPPPPNKFSVVVSVQSSTPTTQVYLISVPIVSGVALPITLKQTGLFHNITRSWSPGLSITSGGSATLSLSFARQTFNYINSFTIIAKGGGKKKNVSVALTVTGFSLRNGGFEAVNNGLTHWAKNGGASLVTAAAQSAAGFQAVQPGSHAVLLGGAGLSSVTQSFTVPALMHYITFHYYQQCNNTSGDGSYFSVIFIDHALGTTASLVNNICVQDTDWVSQKVFIGTHRKNYVTITFTNEDGGSGAVTYVDSISLSRT